MPLLDRATLERHLGRLNERRPRDELVRVEAFDEKAGRFALSFPNRAMPEGQCIDQDFSDIQWALHEHAGVDTGIQGGRHDPETDRYVMEYEVIVWDEPTDDAAGSDTAPAADGPA